MKKILKIGISALTVLFINQSCSDYLDVVPDDTPTLEIAFENRVTAESYLATTYSSMPDFKSPNNPALFGGDELWINESAQRDNLGNVSGLEIAQGQQSEGRTLLSYMNGTDGTPNLYEAIRRCNVLLEYIHLPVDMSTAEKNQWAAEVKVLKAYYHFYLMRMYGPVPIIRENLPVHVSQEEARVERESVDELVTYMVSLIDESMEFLSSETTGVSEEGRINKVVAAAIKAKILMTAASPLFNGNTDFTSLVNSENKELINATYDPEKWVKAAEACQEAILIAEAEGHSLYEFPLDNLGGSTLSDITKTKLSIRGSVTEKDNNDEVIWKATGRKNNLQSRSMAKMNDPLAEITQFAHTSIQSYYAPTMRIAEMFYTENGLPINEDINYDYGDRYGLRVSDPTTSLNIKQGYTTANLHYFREPRFYASLSFDGGVWFGQGREDEDLTWYAELKGGQAAGFTGDPNDNTWSATGYLPKKLVHYESQHVGAGFNQDVYSWPIIRLADIYLLYAEALNEVSGPSNEVFHYIDLVRERAGIPDIQTAWTTNSFSPDKINDQNELRKIIHHERMIELVFEGHRFWDLRRWKRAQEFMSNQSIRGWKVESGSIGGFYNINTLFQQRYESKDYLWPIPLTNILNNPNLVQNPGW